MRNDTAEPAPTETPAPIAAPPLLILSSDDDALCTDELCLPAKARVDVHPEVHGDAEVPA